MYPSVQMFWDLLHTLQGSHRVGEPVEIVTNHICVYFPVFFFGADAREIFGVGVVVGACVSVDGS